MPVRNFWIDVDIDGRATQLSGGPKSKSGGMVAKVFIRNDGSIVHALSIVCDAYADGKLTICVEDVTTGKSIEVVARR